MRQAAASWQIVPLDSKAHDRAAFSCGAPELDRYIREHASQDVRRDVARVFVALLAGTPTVCGYYSLSAASFQRDNLPADEARRLPRYPVPAALLGRLAVDDGMKGRGVGTFLLMDALNRVLLATQTLAVHAVIVDARDDAAGGFYRKYGFLPFTGEGRRLFLPMATIRTLAEP
ncbi:MAG: GNAT family N-acetyltransferase [Defluviicoccus sp.]